MTTTILQKRSIPSTDSVPNATAGSTKSLKQAVASNVETTLSVGLSTRTTGTPSGGFNGTDTHDHQSFPLLGDFRHSPVRSNGVAEGTTPSNNIGIVDATRELETHLSEYPNGTTQKRTETQPDTRGDSRTSNSPASDGRTSGGGEERAATQSGGTSSQGAVAGPLQGRGRGRVTASGVGGAPDLACLGSGGTRRGFTRARETKRSGIARRCPILDTADDTDTVNNLGYFGA